MSLRKMKRALTILCLEFPHGTEMIAILPTSERHFPHFCPPTSFSPKYTPLQPHSFSSIPGTFQASFSFSSFALSVLLGNFQQIFPWLTHSKHSDLQTSSRKPFLTTHIYIPVVLQPLVISFLSLSKIVIFVYIFIVSPSKGKVLRARLLFKGFHIQSSTSNTKHKMRQR